MKYQPAIMGIVIVCSMLCLSGSVVMAQGAGLDYRDYPVYDEENLFSPIRNELYVVEDGMIEVGGRIDASLDPYIYDPTVVLVDRRGSVDWRTNADYCLGYTTSEPTFRLYWEGSSGWLRIFFEPSQPDSDTTLIVRDPYGDWYCNDDSYDTFSPTLTFPIRGGGGASEGRYDIWVGTYSRQTVDGWLFITQDSSYYPNQ